MRTALYHIPRFFLRQRRVVIPDYARCFRLWYERHRRQWWLPELTALQERAIFLWERRRCDRHRPDRSIIDDRDGSLAGLCILYLHYLDSKILRHHGDIAILTPDVAATRAFCRSIGMDMRRTIVRPLRNPRSLQGRTCDLALILDAHRAPRGDRFTSCADDRFHQALAVLLPMMDYSDRCYFLLHGSTAVDHRGRPRTRRSRGRTSFHRFADDLASRPTTANPYQEVSTQSIDTQSVGTSLRDVQPPCDFPPVGPPHHATAVPIVTQGPMKSDPSDSPRTIGPCPRRCVRKDADLFVTPYTERSEGVRGRLRQLGGVRPRTPISAHQHCQKRSCHSCLSCHFCPLTARAGPV